MPLSLKPSINSTRLKAIRKARPKPQAVTDAPGQAEPGEPSNGQLKKLHMKAARDLLKSYPAIHKELPLKIGIIDDLLAVRGEIPEKFIRYALRERTQRNNYLCNMAAGGHRHDLAGNKVEEITAEHQQHAADLMAGKQQEK